MNMSSTATPIYEVALEGAKEVVTVNCGDLGVSVSKNPVIVSPPIVHVPETLPTSLSGTASLHPLVAVNAAVGRAE